MPAIVDAPGVSARDARPGARGPRPRRRRAAAGALRRAGERPRGQEQPHRPGQRRRPRRRGPGGRDDPRRPARTTRSWPRRAAAARASRASRGWWIRSTARSTTCGASPSGASASPPATPRAPLVGVVHDPCRGETFTRRRGARRAPRRRAPARCARRAALSRGADRHRLQLPRRGAGAPGASACCGCCPRSATCAASARPRSTWRGSPRAGSTATSRPGLNPWDSAAGELLVREAGGVVEELPRPGPRGGRARISSARCARSCATPTGEHRRRRAALGGRRAPHPGHRDDGRLPRRLRRLPARAQRRRRSLRRRLAGAAGGLRVDLPVRGRREPGDLQRPGARARALGRSRSTAATCAAPLQVAAAALLVSAATWVALGDEWVRFGVLHCIAVAMLVGPLLVPPGLVERAARRGRHRRWGWR